METRCVSWLKNGITRAIATIPENIQNVDKVKVLKRNPNKNEKPKSFQSFNNVSILVDELTKTGISFTITDTNENPYRYPDNYQITRRDIKPQENTIVYTPISKDDKSKNSIPAVSPTQQYISSEVPRISDISPEDIAINEKQPNKNTIKKTYDWSRLYGELGSGAYTFTLFVNKSSLDHITIDFNITSEGKISFKSPQIYL